MHFKKVRCHLSALAEQEYGNVMKGLDCLQQKEPVFSL